MFVKCIFATLISFGIFGETYAAKNCVKIALSQKSGVFKSFSNGDCTWSLLEPGRFKNQMLSLRLLSSGIPNILGIPFPGSGFTVNTKDLTSKIEQGCAVITKTQSKCPQTNQLNCSKTVYRATYSSQGYLTLTVPGGHQTTVLYKYTDCNSSAQNPTTYPSTTGQGLSTQDYNYNKIVVTDTSNILSTQPYHAITQNNTINSTYPGMAQGTLIFGNASSIVVIACCTIVITLMFEVAFFLLWKRYGTENRKRKTSIQTVKEIKDLNLNHGQLNINHKEDPNPYLQPLEFVNRVNALPEQRSYDDRFEESPYVVCVE